MVKSPGGDTLSGRANVTLQSMDQLFGCPPGKGQQQNALCRDFLLLNQVNYPGNDGAGFAGSRTGQNQQVFVVTLVMSSMLLLGVQFHY